MEMGGSSAVRSITSVLCAAICGCVGSGCREELGLGFGGT